MLEGGQRKKCTNIDKILYKDNRRVKRHCGLLLHNVLGLPDDGIGVEVSCGVKPEKKLLLSVPLALSVDIGVQNVGVTTKIPQELEVDLIMSWPLRRQLQKQSTKIVNYLYAQEQRFRGRHEESLFTCM